MGLVELSRHGRHRGTPANGAVLAPAVALAVLAALLAALRFLRVGRPAAATSASPAAAGTGGTGLRVRGGRLVRQHRRAVRSRPPGQVPRPPRPAAAASPPRSPSSSATRPRPRTSTPRSTSRSSARYASASPAERATILAQDSAWLAARGAGVRRRLQHRRHHRRDQRRGLPARREQRPARRGQGDHPAGGQCSRAPTAPTRTSCPGTPRRKGPASPRSTPRATRPAAAIVAWVIVGGADGFVVNPKQFYFQDGSFTDPGIARAAEPRLFTASRPARSTSSPSTTPRLAKDPNANKSAAGYLYAPGTPVAVWR